MPKVSSLVRITTASHSIGNAMDMMTAKITPMRRNALTMEVGQNCLDFDEV